jgi:hypothetical protein
MGLFPCSLCAKRFRGPAQTIYPSLIDGNDRQSAHLRLCADCYAEVIDDLQSKAVQLSYEEGMDTEVSLCAVCGNPVQREKSLAVFATVFARGEDRVDFLGGVHKECADPLKAAWRLSRAS